MTSSQPPEAGVGQSSSNGSSLTTEGEPQVIPVAPVAESILLPTRELARALSLTGGTAMQVGALLRPEGMVAASRLPALPLPCLDLIPASQRNITSQRSRTRR